MERPELRFLHPQASLSQAKLAEFKKWTTEKLIASLQPGDRGALKVRPDGTILDGHHRVWILRERGEDIEALPREVVPKEPEP